MPLCIKHVTLVILTSIDINGAVIDKPVLVYDISVLSNIPLAVTDLLAPTAPPQRLRPLFSIGVHDIPFLEDDLKASSSQPVIEDEDEDETEEAGRGWIACTTDDIITMKNSLYDVLITLPPSYST